jgi:hypothetical protein
MLTRPVASRPRPRPRPRPEEARPRTNITAVRILAFNKSFKLFINDGMRGRLDTTRYTSYRESKSEPT